MDLVDEYVRANKLQTQDMIYLSDEFSDEFAKMYGECIDIGCGPGLSTQQLLSQMPVDSNVVGSDISKQMIEFARTKHAAEKRLCFIELNIAVKNLPLNLTGVFHNAVSIHCLHWCTDLRQAFANIYKLLRPGGKALVIFMTRHACYDVYPKLHNYPEYKSYMEDFFDFVPQFQNHKNPRKALKKVIEESGFEVLHCSNRERTFIFENWDIIKQHAVAVNPFIKRMPDNLQKKYAEDLVRELGNLEHAILKTNNESTKPHNILDVYNVLIAHFKKPIDM